MEIKETISMASGEEPHRIPSQNKHTCLCCGKAHLKRSANTSPSTFHAGEWGGAHRNNTGEQQPQSQKFVIMLENHFMYSEGRVPPPLEPAHSRVPNALRAMEKQQLPVLSSNTTHSSILYLATATQRWKHFSRTHRNKTIDSDCSICSA